MEDAMNHKASGLACLLVGSAAQCLASPQGGLRLDSPGGAVQLALACTETSLTYRVSFRGRVIVDPSEIVIASGTAYRNGEPRIEEVDVRWEAPWGSRREMRDHCRQLTLPFSASGMQADLVVRVYDDGVAFRFVLPALAGSAPRAVDFVSGAAFAPGAVYHYPNREHEPVGPVSISEPPPPAAKDRQLPDLPILVEAGDGVFVGLLESDLFSARGFSTAKVAAEPALRRLRCSSPAELDASGGTTPWRVLLFADQPGALALSPTPLNLAADCRIADPSWVRPGKALWDWRVHGYRSGDFEYGTTTESYLRFIDFAGRNGIDYFVIDDGWYDRIEDGRIVPNPRVDLDAVMARARERGVGVVLYYDRRRGDSLGDDKLFETYAALGAVGIKYGFMGNDADFTRRAIEESARHRLLVNFHDNPSPMTGTDRTMPNAITREFCHAQQDDRRAFTPSAFLKMAMINALTGPLDMANGIFGLDGVNRGERQRGPRIQESLNSTAAGEAARVVIVSSGLVVLPDAPEEYEKKADLFEFIRELPARWDESRMLRSAIGRHISIARRAGREWFVASAVDEQGGTLPISLDFLEPGVDYLATFYEDTEDTHYIRNRESYRVRHGQVSARDAVEARLAPGGGHGIWLRPATN